MTASAASAAARHCVLVEKFAFSFSGTLSPNALLVGDVDNDSDNEIVVGSLSGELAVIKGRPSRRQDGAGGAAAKPRFFASDLGSIVCVALGDVRNCGRASLVVVAGEGIAHIFDLASSKDAKAAIVPTVSLRIPLNVSSALVCDVDGDGKQELVLGSRNKAVHFFELRADRSADASSAERLIVKREQLALPSQVCVSCGCAVLLR